MKLHFSFYLDYLIHPYMIQNESLWLLKPHKPTMVTMAFVLEVWNTKAHGGWLVFITTWPQDSETAETPKEVPFLWGMELDKTDVLLPGSTYIWSKEV